MAAKDHTSRSRFVVACGVLSRCVRAKAGAGLTAAAHAQARPAVTASMMLLMPGADVAAPGVIRDEAAAATPSQAAQLKIVYGGRVLVFDDVPADRAAELLLLAARRDVPAGATTEDIPVARKASLQRFMEKRRDRLAAQAPYGSAASRPAVASKGREQEGDVGACWLGLGIAGGHVR